MKNQDRIIMRTMNSTDALAEYDRLALIAKNTPCDFDDCDGSLHGIRDEPADFCHRVFAEAFEGIVDLSITGTTAGFIGELDFGAEQEMTSSEFRTAADKYEAFPAWLRAQADRLDALNTAHRA